MDEKLKLAEAELQLAAENLAAAKLVSANGLYRNAVTDLYYAAYHAVVALLTAHGFEASTHDGVQTLFGLHFVKEGMADKNAGKYLGSLYHARLTADYKGYVDLDRSDYDDAVQQARIVVQASVNCLRQAGPTLRTDRIGALLADL